MASTTINLLGLQPDFLRLSQIHNEIANEMIKFPNIPRFDPHNAILQTLEGLSRKFDTLSERINTVTQQLNRKIDTVNKKIDTITQRMDTLETRQQAR